MGRNHAYAQIVSVESLFPWRVDGNYVAPVMHATREEDRNAFMPNRRIPKTTIEKKKRGKEIHIIDIGRSVQGEARKRGREREQYKEKKRENETGGRYIDNFVQVYASL